MPIAVCARGVSGKEPGEGQQEQSGILWKCKDRVGKWYVSQSGGKWLPAVPSMVLDALRLPVGRALPDSPSWLGRCAAALLCVPRQSTPVLAWSCLCVIGPTVCAVFQAMIQSELRARACCYVRWASSSTASLFVCVFAARGGLTAPWQRCNEGPRRAWCW